MFVEQGFFFASASRAASLVELNLFTGRVESALMRRLVKLLVIGKNKIKCLIMSLFSSFPFPFLFIL
jgi:hypothetical protein